MAAIIKLKSSKPENLWLSSSDFERLLSDNREKIFTGRKSLTFTVPAKTILPLETIVRLLSLLNQFTSEGFKTKLKFNGKNSKTMGYCDRMGFFDFINDNVVIEPSPPEKSGKSRFQNNNGSLVELEVINSDSFDEGLSQKLAKTIIDNLPEVDEATKKKLFLIYHTIFSELTKNVHEHSKTKLDGYAAMQLYKRGERPRAELIICDSGLGLLETLRPSLHSHNSKYENFADKELIIEMLIKGISSKAPEEYGGDGLEACFRHARKMNSDLTIRLENEQFRLFKVRDHENIVNALMTTRDMVALKGTFICFQIPLYL